MKTTMRIIQKILLGLSFTCLALSCQQEEIFIDKGNNNSTSYEVGVFGDEMRVRLGIVAPDPIEIATRGVDPDGKALQTLTVFCFDRNGLLISTSTAKVNPKPGVEDNTEGTIFVSLPVATRIMHLVGNQNMTRFDKNTFTNKSEDEVLSILEGSAGMLIYWARVEVPNNVNSLYTEAEYELPNGNPGTATEVHRTEAEAIVDWLTIETNPEENIHRGIEGKGFPIVFLRNQARFSIVSEGWEDYVETNPVTGVTAKPMDEWKGTYFEVTGFAICNSPAFGTVAPYHTDYGFPTYQWSEYTPYYGVEDGIKGNWCEDANSVTLPARRDKLTDVTDVSNAHDQFIFETINSSTDPVDLILRGYNIVDGVRETQERYYYRVNMIDEEGEMITIRRNHQYKIHIVDNLTNGVPTFDEALKAPATNNIWFSISDEVKAIRDKEVELSVEKTKIVVDANDLEEDYFARMQTFQFNVTPLTNDVTLTREKLTVRWVEDNQQVSTTHNPSFAEGGDAVYFDTSTGEGIIGVQLLELPEGEMMRKATLLVKYGRLQRKITIVIVRKQEFVPAWVSSEVYGKLTGEDYKGEHVTVIFTIPKTTPAELFPMKVLVTTNGLDGRATSGQTLPIVAKGEDGYGEEFQYVVNEGTEDEKVLTDLGYKYEYTVDAPGQHRLYFRNIFEVEDGAVEYVVLQADHFHTIAKPVTYVDHQNALRVPALFTFTAVEGAPESEQIPYLLVAQKRFAPVQLDVAVDVKDGTSFSEIGDNEEFLLYSTNLDHYPDDDSRLYAYQKEQFDCYFKPYDESYWSTGGRIYGFYPRIDKFNAGKLWDALYGYQGFQIYMETNKPKSAEVVRIASNQKGSPQVKDASQEYDGMTFRSVTFELANYRPFRFAAQIKAEENFDFGYEGTYKVDPVDNPSSETEPEVIDNIQFTYLPDQTVEVAFDITSFSSTDGSTVDPFGTGFEIFIDSPILELVEGDNPLIENKSVNMFDKTEFGEHYVERKPKLEDLGNGRFVYRVDPDYGVEQSFFPTEALIQDPRNFSQVGDRKVIKFRKTSIVSIGQITISANPDHVTYHSKTFNITNEPINGRIGYVTEDENGNQLDILSVPADQFVSFSRLYDDSRIGSLIVKANNDANPLEGTYYDLRLRGEYEFNWRNDPIKVQTQVGGKFYSTIIPDLETLYNNTTILLSLEK